SVVRPVVMIRSGAVALACLLAALYNAATGARLDPVMIATAAALIVTVAALDGLESVAFGRRIVRYSSLLNLANSLAWLSCRYALPAHLLDARSILALYTALLAVQTGLYALLLHGSGPADPTGAAERAAITYLLRRSLPYLWLNLTGIVFVQAPVLLLAA